MDDLEYFNESQETIANLETELDKALANADFNGRRAANQALQLRQLNEAVMRRNYTIRALRTRLADATLALDFLRGEAETDEVVEYVAAVSNG